MIDTKGDYPRIIISKKKQDYFDKLHNVVYLYYCIKYLPCKNGSSFNISSDYFGNFSLILLVHTN